MKLKIWMAIEGLTGVELAEKLGVTDGAVSRWTAGDRIPRPDQMKEIIKVTKGKVQPQDFYS